LKQRHEEAEAEKAAENKEDIIMKLSTTIGVGILSLLLGVPAGVLAQAEPKQEEPKTEPKQDEAKPPKQEQPKPESKQDEMKPPKQEKQDQKEQKQEQKQEKDNAKHSNQGNMPAPNHQESAPAQTGQPQPSHAEGGRPAGGGGHIPDDKFRANFGRSHSFTVQRTTVSGGQSGFVYGGYTFVLVDAWPDDWAYSDECYVDYIDGEYFLFDLLHPGVRIALFVVM
jgi:outer membrane biosynthesis protein TonB